MDGLDIYVAGKATVNFVFDRYMSLKTNLRQTTRSNYLYMYDRFIRDTFGKKKIAEIRYSTCCSSHQQTKTKPKSHLWGGKRRQPKEGKEKKEKFRAMRGGGLREVGKRQLPGLLHGAVVTGSGEHEGEGWGGGETKEGAPAQHSSSIMAHRSAHPKLQNGSMSDAILSCLILKEPWKRRKKKKESGGTMEIDKSGFIFCNRFGNVPNPQSVNCAIKRIIADYNAGEEVEAKKRYREAVLLPDFFGTSSAAHVLHKALRERDQPEGHPIGHGA